MNAKRIRGLESIIQRPEGRINAAKREKKTVVCEYSLRACKERQRKRGRQCLNSVKCESTPKAKKKDVRADI